MHMSLAAVLGESAVRYGNRTAIVENDEQISYATLWRQARAYATALGDLGVEPGFTVALMLPTSSDFIRSYFGALALGAVVVPVNILLTAEEVEFVLRDSGASALVADESVLDVAVSASNAAGTDLFTVGGGATRPGTDGGRARLDLLAGLAEPIPTAVLRRPDHAAVVLYTSGTTGKPKGAVLTHSNMLMNATIMAFDAIDLRSDDRVLCCLPLFHTFGQSVTMNATLRRGATLVLMSRFRGDGALDLMAEQDVTVFQGVPTMYMALLDAAAGRDVVHKLRFCLSGGAPIPVAVLEQVERTFSTTVLEGYGLSETSPVVTFNQPAHGVRHGTVGHPIWGVETQIARSEVEDRIELLPAGEVGEVVVRGHGVFKGYLNRPESTAAALVDGWFRTGDIGCRDADGFLSIVDRKKDMIIRGGYNVYPREIEEVLSRHPDIARVAVVGSPHRTHGEEIRAVVVARRAELTAEEVVAWSRDRLGRYKYPRIIDFTDSLPLGPTGKILKRELTASAGG
jgi:long-chain acyl-CoA synthetase